MIHGCMAQKLSFINKFFIPGAPVQVHTNTVTVQKHSLHSPGYIFVPIYKHRLLYTDSRYSTRFQAGFIS